MSSQQPPSLASTQLHSTSVMSTSPAEGAEGAVDPLQMAVSEKSPFLNFTPMVSIPNFPSYYVFLFSWVTFINFRQRFGTRRSEQFPSQYFGTGLRNTATVFTELKDRVGKENRKHRQPRRNNLAKSLIVPLFRRMSPSFSKSLDFRTISNNVRCGDNSYNSLGAVYCNVSHLPSDQYLRLLKTIDYFSI